MKSTNYAICSLLILAAVVPEIISGTTVPVESNLKSSVRQTVGCSGQCFRLRSRAVQDCRVGTIAGNVCVVRNGCNPAVPNGGYECIFIRGATVSPPTLAPTGVTCPNNCFVPSTASAGAIQAAQSSATQDCVGRFPTCLVRPCSAIPLNGFICSRPCPNICRASAAMAATDCAGAVRCTVQPCTLPSGALGASCGTPTALTVVTPTGSTPSVSPTMTPGASPSVTPTAAASPSVSSSPSPTPTVTVSATPSPSCTFTIGAIGQAPATAFCMCGSETATVIVPGSVDDRGMALDVAAEVAGGTAYSTCVVTALRRLCTPDMFATFASRGETDVTNCCAANVVDGMGINTATNQCRIGDGCAPIVIPAVSVLILATPMGSCTCSGTTTNIPLLQLLDISSGTAAPFGSLNGAQVASADTFRNCLITMLGALCDSADFPGLPASATAVVDACCVGPATFDMTARTCAI